MNANESTGETYDGQIHSRRNPVYKFSPEEIRVMKECSRESFYRRCIPLCGLFGFGAYWAVNSGFLKANAKFGAVPKVCGAVFVGYILGKVSYQRVCAERLMQLPGSKLGELYRRRHGKGDSGLDGIGTAMSLSPFSSINTSDSQSDVDSYPRQDSSLDYDGQVPQFDGLDENFRPSVDNPIYEEEMPPIQKFTTTYDELRKQNREQYQQKRIGKEPSLPSGIITQPVDRDSSKRNKYGDAWEA